MSLAFLALFGLLLAANYQHGIALGQDSEMYTAPFRWRQSIVVALSREATPPLGGYLGYRDIEDFLNRNGLAIQASENGGVQPEVAEWMRFVTNGAALDALLSRARSVPVDPTRPPSLIGGNEKGLADFFSLAFALFGHNVAAFYKTYFLLLLVATAAYAAAFRAQPALLFVLGAYLLVHYAMMDYASGAGDALGTVHNSRFFSVLALLPAGHILFAMLTRQRAGPVAVATLAVQCVLLLFLVFCRLEAFWLVAMLLAAGVLAVLRQTVPRLLRRRAERLRRAATLPWAFLILLGGLGAYYVYPAVALAPEYRLASSSHLFWHPVFIGLVSAHPKLQALYLRGPEHAYSDEPGYLAVIARLNETDDMSSPIAYRQADGTISIDLMKGWGEYDRLLRPIVFDILLNYPIESIAGLWNKINQQIVTFDARGAFDLGTFLPALLLAPFLALLALLGGAAPFSAHGMGIAGLSAAAFAVFSLATPAILPSLLAVGLLGVWLLLVVLALAFPPVALGWQLARRAGRHRRSVGPLAAGPYARSR